MFFLLVFAFVSLCLAAVLGWWRFFSKSQELQTLQNQITLQEERLRATSYLGGKYDDLQNRYQILLKEASEAQAALKYEKEQSSNLKVWLEKWTQHLQENFEHLSQKALLSNNENFLQTAQLMFEKFHSTAQIDLENRQKNIMEGLQPIGKTLGSVHEALGILEKERLQTYTELKEQILALSLTQKELRFETHNLAKALKAPSTRGQWGEMQLKRVVEMAGMVSHCDFIEQPTGSDGLRPDLIVNLPGNKKIIIDAKAPLQAYLQSLEAGQESERQTLLEQHARHIRQHIRILSQRAYWEQFQPTPEFVILFLPGEAFFSTALEKDPTLIEGGVRERVILATPTTLIALLRAVAYGWQQENLAQNIRSMSELGGELYKRLCDMSQHFEKMGTHLGRAVESYNQTLGTFERRTLVTARKFKELGGFQAKGDLPDLTPLELLPRRGSSIETEETSE